MNIVLIFAIITVILIIAYILWDMKKRNAKIEKIIVIYSEKVGDTIIEHEKQYLGLVNYEKDLFKVPKLNIIKPVPDSNVMIPTITGKKKVNLIKIDSFRVGFRVPTLHNQIYIQKRDKYGNILKNKNGKPVLKKYNWLYCDDVIEPDVKHWNENIMEKLKQKHRTKADMLSKWIAPIMVGLILIAGIVTIQMTTKFVMNSVDKQVTLAEQTEEQAKENTGLINNILKRMDNSNEGVNPG